jgi:hypothetical protein
VSQMPPPYRPYPPPYNVYAILSLVLALFVLPPLGIYFGRKARQEIALSGERGAELATAGIVCGWVLTALLGVFMVIWCVAAVLWFSAFSAATVTG